jgi:subtilisin family serine protease
MKSSSARRFGAGFLACGLLHTGATAGEVHPLVREEAAAGQAEFLVILDEQADLGSVAALRSKSERGRAVFDSLTEVASRTQAPLIAELEARGLSYRPYWIANMIWVRGDLEAAEMLAARSDVRRLDANPWLPLDRRPANVAAAPAAIEWGIQQILADQVWALGYTGDGIVVAGHDTGYEWDHPALIQRYRGWNGSVATHDYNWHDAIHSGGGSCGHDSVEPCDDIDHGTHTMGTMVGDDGGSNRIGVSPGARWIGCRNMKSGNGTPTTYSECFQFFLAPTDLAGNNPDPDLAPHVINNSWTCSVGEGCSPDTLRMVVENTRAAGIVVVAAATNLGDDCSSIDQAPAIYEMAITVGATDSDDDIAQLSARGPVTVDGSGRIKPDVSAPGIGVRSSVRGGGYETWDGTSMAAPHVAGQIALLLDARPDLIGRVDEIETLVKLSALPRTSSQNCGGIPGSAVPNPVYGYGRIDTLEMLLGDVDADGVNNLNDCAPIDETVWAVPGPEVELSLGRTPSATELTWNPPPSTGGEAVDYDVLRSTGAADLAAATCIESGRPGTTALDPEIPESLFYYLIRALNSCGATLGIQSGGAPRVGPDCPDSL